MELTGKIIEIQDEREITPKFRKRSMILETTDDKYPQVHEVEFKQDRGRLLDKWAVGQNVVVSINLTGRKWEGPKGLRYFTGIEGWRIADIKTGGDRPDGGMPPSNDDDDIPF